MDKKIIAAVVIGLLTLIGGYFGIPVVGCKVADVAPVAVETPAE